MARDRRKIWTKAEIDAANPIFLQGEPILVDDGTMLQEWKGLDGVRDPDAPDGWSGTRWLDLPEKQWTNKPGTATGGGSQVYQYDPQTALYPTTGQEAKIFVGPVDPGPAGLNVAQNADLWFQDTFVAAPTNLQGSVVEVNKVNLSWVDQSDNEDGFKIQRAEYLDWGLDVSDAQEISANKVVLYDGVYYMCTTTHAVGTPKTFNSANYTESALQYAQVDETAAGVTSRQITGNAYSTRYSFRVFSFVGTTLSPSAPTIVVKTSAASSSQTTMIQALNNLWTMLRLNDAASPLQDSTTNNRDFTGSANTGYQQAAIETGDAGSYSVRNTAQQACLIYRDEVWSLAQNWEMGVLIRVPTGKAFVGGKAWFGLTNTGGPCRIRVWTDSTTPAKTRISLIDNNSAWWSGAIGTKTLEVNVTYFLSLKYDHSTKVLSCYIDGVLDSQLSRDLSTLFTVNRVVGNGDGTSPNNQDMFSQNLYIIVGGFMDDSQRLSIAQAGQYPA